MKQLRPSGYLNYVDIDGDTSLLFSGSTLCMDLVPTEYATLLTKGTDLDFLSPEEKAHLVKRGHLTGLTPDRERVLFRKSVGVISRKVVQANKKQKKASLTFILTYNCNLACTYCFQSDLSRDIRRPTMTADFVDAFFSDCFPKLFPTRPKQCLYTLFGGEPLLPTNREAITRILAHIRKLSSSKVNVATNATTLPSMLDLIGPEKGKIQSVQITLDGDRPFHDESRISILGKPTFDMMISSIRQVIRAKADVSIRVHMHPHRLAAAETLVKYLDQEGLLVHPQVYVYFQPLNDFTMEQQTPEDLEIFRRVFQYIASRTGRPPSHLMFINGFLEMQKEKHLPTTRYCGLGSRAFYVVDPFGDIYQCYDEAGCKDRRVGSFVNGELKYFALKEKYGRRQLINIPECLKCSVALYCGGGCPVRARTTAGSIFRPYCQQNKEFVAQTVKAFFVRNTARKNQQQSASWRVSQKPENDWERG